MSSKIAELIQVRELLAAEYLQKQAALDELIIKEAEHHRKHTPIVSRQQQKLFGAVASGSKKLPGLSKKEAEDHLRESKGKDLPKTHHKKSEMADWYWPAIASGALGVLPGALAGGVLGMGIGGQVGEDDFLAQLRHPYIDNMDNAKIGAILGALAGGGLGASAGYNIYDILNTSRNRHPEMYTAMSMPHQILQANVRDSKNEFEPEQPKSAVTKKEGLSKKEPTEKEKNAALAIEALKALGIV